MRVLIAVLLCPLLLGGGTAAGEDEPREPARPLSPAGSAAAVTTAIKAHDTVALKALAARDDPDPWLVADELCHHGKHDAAEAFAQAAPRKAIERLPAYVTSRRTQEPDQVGRRALREVEAAFRASEGQAAIDAAVPLKGRIDTPTRVRVTSGAGIALGILKRHKESVERLTQGANAAFDLGWLVGAAAAFKRAGWSAQRASDWKAAIAAWNAGLRIERTLEKENAVSEALNDLGILYWRLGHFDEASACYEESLGIVRRLDDKRGICFTLNNLGVLNESRGRYDAALGQYDEALALSRERRDDLGIADALNNIGLVHKLRGDFPRALACLDEALTIQRTRDDQGGVASALLNIGIVHEALSNYPEALSFYEKSLKIIRRLGQKVQEAAALHNIGTVHRSLGAYPLAIKQLEASLRIKRRLGDKAGIASTLNSLGLVQQDFGRFDRALAHLNEALALQTEMENKTGVAAALHNIGSIYLAHGDTQAAREQFEDALAVKRALRDRAGISNTLSILAHVQMLLGLSSQAVAGYEEALVITRDLGMTVGTAQALNNLGILYRSHGDLPRALATFEEARRVLEKAPDRRSQAMVRWSLASTYLLQHNAGRAADMAAEGVELVTGLTGGLADVEGAGARDVFAGLFDVGYRAAFEAGRADQLLWFLEQGRAGSLREALGSGGALEAAVVPKDLRLALALARSEEDRTLRAYRKAVRGRARAAKRKARQAWKAAQTRVADAVARVERDAKAASSVTLGRTDDLDTIRSFLRADEALVLYALTKGDALALVVRAGGARMVRLSSSDTIRKAAASALGGADHQVVPEAAKRLRALVAEPLVLGKDVAHVLISPMGPLGYVPFALLFPSKVVTYTPSGTTHGLLRMRKTPPGHGVLALGDPDYRATGGHGPLTNLAPLPASRAEVEAVGTTKLLGAAASESALPTALASQKRWRAVHFACHGLVDPEHPMFSSLALTAGEEHDGLLTALEVFRMEIPADLVVMSACETGKGRIYKTEGIVGLTRAFMFAGSPRVICSLWKVDDHATQALMTEFYRLWNQKDPATRLGAAAALKKAQEFVRGHAKWKHPHYWAAWVLWGLPR